MKNLARWPLSPAGLAILLAACGGSGAGGSSGPSVGAPITGLTPGVWTWVDFPDSACSDGSPTGIGVSPGTGPDLVLYLEGGGACSSAFTCFTLQTASLGPFGSAQFADLLPSRAPGSLLDRTLPGSPFADATLVYIPYCTGDVHGGDRVATYENPNRTVHHVGHSNILAYLARLAPTFPDPRRLVVTGSSAGGFGSLVNYPTFRERWPRSQGFVIDDSGPPLPTDGGPLVIQPGLTAWGLSELLPTVCDDAVACGRNLSLALKSLLGRYPDNRFGLVSWSADPVISAFFGLSSSRFPVLLDELIASVIEPAPNARAFVKSGSGHTLFGEPTTEQAGVSLATWVGQEVEGSGAWATVR